MSHLWNLQIFWKLNVKTMKYQHAQIPTFRNSKSLIRALSKTLIEPMQNPTSFKNTAPYDIACSHSFSWLVQVSPKVPKLPLNDAQSVPKRLPSPKTLEKTKTYKHHSKTSTKSNEYHVYLFSCTLRPWSEVQSQRSQLGGPGFKVQNKVGGPWRTSMISWPKYKEILV